MPKSEIFVSCGQRTEEEKNLANSLCTVIRKHGIFDFFFAEFQHNLHGLNENILDALERAAGFVTVMHERGSVNYGGGVSGGLVRASVWIEQEIAIAAYIQRTTKRNLLTAAYIQQGVGREGIRDLLHLNPRPFTTSAEVIADLESKLKDWTAPEVHSLDEDDWGKLELKVTSGYESGLRVFKLIPTLTNKGKRVKEYVCSIDIPVVLLSWSTAIQYIEVPSTRPGYRRFRVTEATKQNAPMERGDVMEMFTIQVSVSHLISDQRTAVYQQPIYARAELGDRSYSLERFGGDFL